MNFLKSLLPLNFQRPLKLGRTRCLCLFVYFRVDEVELGSRIKEEKTGRAFGFLFFFFFVLACLIIARKDVMGVGHRIN